MPPSRQPLRRCNRRQLSNDSSYESPIKCACLWSDTRHTSDSIGPFTSHLTVRLPSRFLQQPLGLLQASSVKALGEPAIDRREQLAHFGPLALLLSQVTQAHGGAQLPGFGLLAVGNDQGLRE